MSTKIKCEKCKTENPVETYFCQRCGAFLHRDQFESEEIFQADERKMMRLIPNLEHVPHTDIPWDAEADRFAARVERLQALFELPNLNVAGVNSSIVGKMKVFLNACRQPEFQIAFVGTIKTGKSTLINALLGKNYASMDVTPETAALTKFRYSARDYVKITFYSKTEWEALWKSRTKEADKFMDEYNRLQAEKVKGKWVGHQEYRQEIENSKVCDELAKWSSSKYPEHYFVKEIEAGISSLPEDFPSCIVFVDTPGLSDPVAYRSEITKAYIRRANAVFVCVEAEKLQKEEVETLSSVFSFSSDNRNKVFVVATKWDRLNSPVKDWDEKQFPYLLRTLVGPAYFADEKTARSNIMYADAYHFNLFREFSKENQEHLSALSAFGVKMGYLPFEKSIDEFINMIEEFKGYTNIATVMKKITDGLAKNYQALLLGQLKEAYQNFVYDLRRVANEKAKDEADMIAATGKDLKEIKEELRQKEDCHKRTIDLQKQLNSFLDSVKKDNQKLLKGMLAKFDGYINELEDKKNKRR